MLLRTSSSGLLSRRFLSPSPFVSRLPVQFRMASTTSNTPMEDTIREKLTTALSPSSLIIRNDSHKHAHHEPMRGSTSKETHFHVTITSPSFQSKMQPARHRLVYGLLKEEMSREGGIHALQLKTRTPEEEERQNQREREGQ